MQLVGTEPVLHPLKSVKPNGWNPNKMSQREFESTKAGLKNDGWLISHSLLIWRTDDAGNNRMVIIDGEHRWKCARALKYKEAPMVFLDGMTEQDAKALTIKLFTRRGTPADEPLSQLLQEMYDPSDNLKLAAMDLGFEDDEFQRLLGIGDDNNSTRDAPSDDPPAPPAEPTTNLGDVWILGPHRLVCGDSTDPEVLNKACDGRDARLVLTDPPYGVDYSSVDRPKGKKSAIDNGDVHNDGKEGLGDLLRRALLGVFDRCEMGAPWYICAPAGPNFLEFAQVLTELEVWRQTIVWVKNCLVIGRSDFHYRHEAIFYGWKPGAAHRAPPDRKQDTVWEFDKPNASKDHPTTKPVKLFVKAIELSTNPGDLVLDPFMGSGTTIMAAEYTGRSACGVEFSPAYCDVVVRRWEKYTGLKAELENAQEA